MKILVCIKAVPELEHAISPGKEIPDASHKVNPEVGIDDSADMRMNRFDEFAVEEAVLIKETFSETIVDVITMGPKNAVKTIKRAIGMGADNGIHIISDYHTSCDAAAVSSCIAQIASEKDYDLILCGVMSEDMMQFAVGPMLAQRLSLPWATSIIYETITPDVQKIYVERELEGGITAMLDISLPALLTIQSGINEPRYPSLSNLLRANKSRIHVFAAETLQPSESFCRTVGYSYPEKKRDSLVLDGTPREKAEVLLQLLRGKGLI